MKALTALLSHEQKDALKRIIIETKSLAGNEDYRKFVIVGVARTGSTLLVNLLNSHSQILAFGELFRSSEAIGWDVQPFAAPDSKSQLALYQSDPLSFLQTRVFRRWPRSTAAVGFKLFYYHAREAPFSAIWDHLRSDTEIRILHLKRRNILAQLLSLQRAHLTDIWAAARTGAMPPKPIRLDPDTCREHFARIRASETECDSFFAAHQVLSIYYEDLTASRAAEMAEVQRFLGLPVEAVSSRIVRQRTDPLSGAIANYDQLVHSFAGTEWAEFFREQPVVAQENRGS